jgi:uncharacterized membrane protein required for colicin V production
VPIPSALLWAQAAAETTEGGGFPLAALDAVGLAIVLVLALLGVVRGLWWQVMRLVGIVAAVALARGFGPRLADWVAEQWPELSPRLAGGAAWLVIFLGALAAVALVGAVGHRLIEAVQLGLANRAVGGFVGAVTGVVLHVALLVVIAQLAPERFVETRVAGTYSGRLLEAVGQRWRVVMAGDAAVEVDRLLAAPARRESGAIPASGMR